MLKIDKTKNFFIAEVGSNHLQSINRCKKFIDVSKKSGFQAIKFQLFKIEDLFHPSTIKKNKLYKIRNRELPKKFIPKLYKYAKQKKIYFGCSVFNIGDIPFLRKYVDFFKVASYELLWLKLIDKLSKTKKPVIISTGMSSFKEVNKVLKLLKKNKNKDVNILRCTSNYPAKKEVVNLKSIVYLKKKIRQNYKFKNINIGYSDHSKLPGVIYRACNKYDAKIIELHLDLDGKGSEFGPGHCWLPLETAEIIKNIQIGLEADGDGNLQPKSSEKNERLWRADPIDGLRPTKKIR